MELITITLILSDIYISYKIPQLEILHVSLSRGTNINNIQIVA